MSLSNRLILPIILSALAVLAGCSSSSSPTPVPPPSGGFSNSNLSGTYVFSVSGADLNGDPYAMVGTLIANGNGGITGGTVDINDAGFPGNSSGVIAPVANAAISGSSSYSVSVDGRGTATLGTSTPFNTIKLAFVLTSSTQGLITEFDNTGSGSGTLDLQTAGVTQSSLAGSYALSFSGVDQGGNGALATVGAFTIDANGNITTGVEDFNDNGTIPYLGQSLGGQVILGPSSTAGTLLTTQNFAMTFDVYAIDATHLKFIEMDTFPILAGDAYAQSSASIPAQTMAFTLSGLIGTTNPAAIGGFMVTDGAGNITSASTEDINDAGTVASAVAFSGTYAAGGTGRFILNLPTGSGFVGGTEYAAYPSSGGLLLLEIDSAGIMTGAAYPQASSLPTFATAQGYGLNLTGYNIANGAEVGDIAEFTAASGGTLTGILDESSSVAGPIPSLAFSSGTVGTGTTSGRYALSTDVGNNTTSTLNGGFGLTLYTVDGTTYPFMESDTGQVATGVIVEQSSSSSAAAAAQSHLFIPRPLSLPHGSRQRKK
jgi:hypothetical protein